MEVQEQNLGPGRITRFLEGLTPLACIRFFISLFLSFKFLQLICSLVVLYITRNEMCKAPLKLFVGIYSLIMILQGLVFYLKNKEYFHVERLADIQENVELGMLSNFVDAFSLFWCLTGFHWAHECKSCRITNPILYYTTLIYSYWGMFIIIFPLVAIVLIVFFITYVRSKLPVIEYKSSTDIKKHDASCSICLNDYNNSEKIKILPCDHHFHQACIDEWFNIDDICPLCKKPVNMLYDLVENNV
ncbi:Zinc finger C3HC4 type protein [Spraguea lophii 42_110]|uniref:Zinc finger C3HC4 type protein n=1 Tax=Spraguea lophii (strain 42_110) TaxID=1358809 RepID=S7XTQ2_SPRLO|nr:Zinc finger C3HC4 type protein [Spraguea lophii 42_110]